ncbi:ADP-ribose pyrophosphatase YjhB, NUDIX family [Pedobacter westerhofensis]|uniref:ADP-ribose pyrophosphatase YjhB, NUDIX family n=1 Tax=Pedobacter westerhofensis TaxID=425512 RepID=A0A521B4R2_9SPHI|nr:NUDIX domain-containing protein [Pedobacter westerhofensis]SMO42055.1 ADP-ribose pyrophosphatase YjhB, NUDIX family [Pedobacter westerhofensis]
MQTEEEFKDFILNGHLHYIPNVSIDCAIFGYHEQTLKLMLIRHRNMSSWSLPGGHIKRSETLVEAASRNVRMHTGLDNLFLQQFKTFGDPNRIQFNKFDKEKWFEITGLTSWEGNWLMDHTISVGFYAVTDFSETVLQTDISIAECAWFDIGSLPPLEFDHSEMVKEALHTMRLHLYHYPIGLNMLPEKFTLSEIHALYETLLGKKLDVSNFPKKLIALGLLNKLTEKRSIGAHRSPHLYSFDREKYTLALKEGLVLS